MLEYFVDNYGSLRTQDDVENFIYRLNHSFTDEYYRMDFEEESWYNDLLQIKNTQMYDEIITDIKQIGKWC